jgi:hypothetical protein
MVEIRKIITTETIFSKVGIATPRPVVLAVGMAMIVNPVAARFADDLRSLFEAGAMLGERLMRELVKLLDGQAVSYGKGAIVGVDGEMERGGEAVISSKVKAAAGASVDVALGHKDDPWSFTHFDTITLSVADTPRSKEILVVMAIAYGGRQQNRRGI